MGCATIPCVRTTVSIDDDGLLAVRERARRERRTVGAVLSDLARQALTDTHNTVAGPPAARHGFSPLPHRGPAVSNTQVDWLREAE